MRLVVSKDIDGLSNKAAEFFFEKAVAAIEKSGRVAVALSGGSTPVLLYRLLASKENAGRVDWNKVHFFFGDERCVAPGSKDSNFRMANEALFLPLGINQKNIHRIKGEEEPAKAAAIYEAEVREFFCADPKETPRFDLVLLGLGEDCHTLSLFPGTKALSEDKRLVAGNYVNRLDSWRVTATFSLTNAAHAAAFLVSGEVKAGALKTALSKDVSIADCPASGIRLSEGELVWFTDEAAASLLRA
ncbi:MAG: 6-phosphogluconolactonase [Deltaproteobacteria bacterium]|nr:6-phosphogluconolactonase [Deltaproteobacteria bacterium]